MILKLNHWSKKLKVGISNKGILAVELNTYYTLRLLKLPEV